MKKQKSSGVSTFRKSNSKKRPGIHSKNSSKNKNSKKYKKLNRGQG